MKSQETSDSIWSARKIVRSFRFKEGAGLFFEEEQNERHSEHRERRHRTEPFFNFSRFSLEPFRSRCRRARASERTESHVRAVYFEQRIEQRRTREGACKVPGDNQKKIPGRTTKDQRQRRTKEAPFGRRGVQWGGEGKGSDVMNMSFVLLLGKVHT